MINNTTFHRTLLFIPMYNCEIQILRVLESINNKFNFGEIIIVDNCSSDRSVDNAKLFIQKNKIINIKIFRNDNNFGLGGSHKVAFNYFLSSPYDYIIVLHGDDQADINDIKTQSDKFHNLDCLLGSRFMKNSSLKGYSSFRKFGNIALNFFITFMTGYYIKDLGSGLNVYSKDYLKNVNYYHFPDGLIFNVYLLYHSILTKSKFAFFPISWRDEDQISSAKVISQGIAIIILALKIRFINNLKKSIINKYSYKTINLLNNS